MKKLLTLFAIVIICSWWHSAQAETEPNNSIAQANDIPLGTSASGTASTSTGDIDFFEVTLLHDGKLRINVTITNGVQSSLQLQHSGGGVVTSISTSGTDSLVSSLTLAAGNYYVYISPSNISSTCTYTITHYSQQYAEGENDLEPNNSAAEAQVFPLNSEEAGHYGFFDQGTWDGTDWWKITTHADGNLHIKLKSLWGAWMYATLYDTDGTTPLYGGGISTCCGYPDSMVVTGLAPGTYLLKISAQWVNTTSPYEIENHLYEPAQANDEEPNNTFAEATKFSLNKTKEGHIGYYGNGQMDGADWYKITTKEGGMLQISIVPFGGHWLYAEVYDKDGITKLKQAWNYFAFDFEIDGLNASTYYLKIYASGALNAVSNPYTVANTFEAYQYPDDDLSNDVAAKAVTIPANGTVYGHIGFTGNLTTDYTDWWKINYTGSGTLNISTDAEAQLLTDWYSHYYTVTIYKDTLAAPLVNYSYLDWSNNNLSNLTAGYYWIRISYWNGFNSYSITNTFTETNIAVINSFKPVTGITCDDHKLQVKCSGSQPPYTVQVYRFGEAFGDPVIIKDNVKFNIKNLPPGNYYITAKGDGASDAAMATSNSKDVVPLPANVEVKNITANSAKISWTGLPDCIDKYEIWYKVSGTTGWTKVTVNGSKVKYTIKELMPSTSYDWSLMAIVKDSTGELEALSEKVTGVFGTTAFGMEISERTGDDEAETVISLYPNPATTHCKVDLEGATGTVEVTVMDAAGKIRWSGSHTIQEQVKSFDLDFTSLSSGIYLVKITSEDGKTRSEKLIISR